MRVLVLLALATTPFLARVSQAQAPGSQGLINGQGHDAAHCAMRAGLHPGAVINKCDAPPAPPVSPPPSASCPNTGALSLGSTSITGKVMNSSLGTVLANWCIELSGVDANGVPVSATTVTNGSGIYTFSGLPAGTFSVCEVVQSGWTLVFPSSAAACPSGVFYTFALAAGDVGAFVNFGNTFP